MKNNRGLQYGYRSGLEMQIDAWLKQRGIDGQYEQNVIHYIKPQTKHKYTPDFTLPNGIIIESKGRFTSDDRKKHLYIQKQYPGLDIRFVFTNPKAKLYKGAKSTYADWCTKNGFLFAKKEIPEEWLDEQKRS